MNKLYALTTFLMITTSFVCTAQDEKPAQAQVARPTKIAIIDPQAVLQASDEWGEKVSEAQKEFQERALNLQKQEEELKKKARAAGTLSKDLVKEQKDIQIEGEALQGEWQQVYQDLQMALAKKVDAAIETVAKAQKWDAVFPKFFYVNSDFDITQATIEEMNKAYKKEKTAKKFKKDPAKTAAPLNAQKA